METIEKHSTNKSSDTTEVLAQISKLSDRLNMHMNANRNAPNPNADNDDEITHAATNVRNNTRFRNRNRQPTQTQATRMQCSTCLGYGHDSHLCPNHDIDNKFRSQNAFSPENSSRKRSASQMSPSFFESNSGRNPPPPQQNAPPHASRQPWGNRSKVYTPLCRDFKKGKCMRGADCKFYHPGEKPCWNFQRTGYCRFGNYCKFTLHGFNRSYYTSYVPTNWNRYPRYPPQQYAPPNPPNYPPPPNYPAPALPQPRYLAIMPPASTPAPTPPAVAPPVVAPVAAPAAPAAPAPAPAPAPVLSQPQTQNFQTQLREINAQVARIARQSQHIGARTARLGALALQRVHLSRNFN